MVLNEESKKEDPIYSTAIQKQKDAASKGFNQLISAVLPPLTLSKVFGKDSNQFIGAYKRFQETKTFDKSTFSQANINIDGYVSLPDKSRLAENLAKNNILSSQTCETEQIYLTSKFASQFGSDAQGESSSQEPRDFDFYNEDNGIGSFSSQRAPDFKLNHSRQVAIINMGNSHLFFFFWARTNVEIF